MNWSNLTPTYILSRGKFPRKLIHSVKLKKYPEKMAAKGDDPFLFGGFCLIFFQGDLFVRAGRAINFERHRLYFHVVCYPCMASFTEKLKSFLFLESTLIVTSTLLGVQIGGNGCVSRFTPSSILDILGQLAVPQTIWIYMMYGPSCMAV